MFLYDEMMKKGNNILLNPLLLARKPHNLFLLILMIYLFIYFEDDINDLLFLLSTNQQL